MVHVEAALERIVRYDREGHWYIEGDLDGGWREKTTLPHAVERALQLEQMGGTIHFGLPGGRLFDKRVRDRKASNRESPPAE